MSLAKLVAKTSPVTLKGIVAEQWFRERVIPPPDKDTWRRASSLAKLCPREEALCQRHSRSREEKFAAKTLLTFAHGTGLHWVVQNVILAPLGIIRGRWSCSMCGFVHGGVEPSKTDLEKARTIYDSLKGFDVEIRDLAGFRTIADGDFITTCIARPERCWACNRYGNVLFFAEQWFGNWEHRVGGRNDGFLWMPSLAEGFGVLEVKSTSTVYKVRSAPQIEHVIQLHTYFWLTGASWGKILYWDKTSTGLGAWIEHTVMRDEETIQEIKSQLMLLDRAVLGGPLPPRICAHSGCPRASICSSTEECFSD